VDKPSVMKTGETSKIVICLPVLIAVSLAFFQFSVSKGQYLKFTSITSHEGLSSNTVNSILKDQYGYLWVATLEGVDRFNGKDSKTYHFNTGNAPQFQSNEVDALYEDPAGTLWVGTMGGGLFRYDRLHDQFHPYPGTGDLTYLNNLKIRTICSDHLGRLWLGTIQCVTVLDPKTNRSVRYLPGGARPGSGNVIAVFEDSKSRMWVGTDQGLYRYNFKTNDFTPYLHDEKNPSSICSNQIGSIAESANGDLWVGTRNGLTRFSGDLQTVKNFYFSPTDEKTLSGNLIYCITADRDKLWIGTEGGLDIMDIQSGRISRYNHNGRDKFSINSKSIRCIYIDPSGIYWVGTYEGGVNKYDRNLTLFNLVQNNEYDAHGLSAPAVTSFAGRADGDIYVGTDGGGLNLFHPGTGLINHIELKEKQKAYTGGLPILSMMLDRHQQLWVGTYQYGLFVYDTRSGRSRQLCAAAGPANINQNDIFSIKEDRLGKIWIGTNGKGVDVYDPVTATFTKYEPGSGTNNLPVNGFIRVIEQDRNQNMWIGTYGTGLAILNAVTHKFTVLNYQNTGFPIDRVFSLLEDHLGNFWIGTGGDGLYYYHTNTRKITAYTAADGGLPDRTIHKILEDDNGNIWISTNKGICSFDTKLQKFTSYSNYNGLQKDAFINGSGFRAANGLLYFGGGDGFNYIDPAKGIKKNKSAPAVLLTSLIVNNQTVVPGKGAPLSEDIAVAKRITINYKQDFSIAYAAINFTLPQQNRYAFKLKGFNRDWNYVGPNTIAYYTNLDPGTYTFMVKACNNDGVWNNQGTQIEIVIRPPLWMTWYAVSAYFLIALATLMFIRHRGIKKVKQKLLLNQERREAEQLHQLDLMKIKFLTNLSHELRTPISLIMAPVDKLLDEHKDQQTASQLAVIRRNARRLLNLVNQLLDFRKIEEREQRLIPAQGEIISFIKDIIDSFHDLSEKQHIELIYKGDDKRLFVWFDHDKVERILFNLLSNGFKFTPPGGKVRVNVSKTQTPENPDEILLNIQVADTGIGIKQENLERIFQRFFRVEDLSAGLNEGSGIGLSITKEFVEMHGGTISIDSKHGLGSVFTVVLPLKVYQSYPVPADGPMNDCLMNDNEAEMGDGDMDENFGTERLRVLVIEDSVELRYYIKNNLKTRYQIYEAADGKEGWDKVLSCHPDLIVSDINMPYMDGIELTKKVKHDKRTSHIPVILLTAFTGDEVQLKGLETGANDYLTKPVNFDILNIKIRNLLSLNTSLKNTYSKQLKVLPANIEVESSGERLLSKAVTCLEKNMNNPEFSVVELSNQMGMSRGALYAKIFELTGKPPVEFIRSFRLDRAAALLLKSDMTVSQIAYEVGFATPHYFSRSFKNKFNVLPSEYRKKVCAKVAELVEK
jgi:signal transduction histidine kinase/ligand-binding sensor domain-containing protein/DNA-binding response OmpR family regulator